MVSGEMHVHAQHVGTRTAQAHLSRDASAGRGEVGGGGSGHGSSPADSGRRATAVVSDGGDERAT